MKLSMDQQERLVAHKKELPGLIALVMARLDEGRAAPTPLKIVATRRVELDEGAGLGERVDRSEGLRRVAAYAKSVPLEEWAGPVAGASELERRFGIKRSTLHDWKQQGAVIGLLRGTRKQVFPVAQFIDGRPVEGISGVLQAIGMPRAAWLWLVQPYPSMGGKSPIDRLKAGRITEVVAAAGNDFGPP